MHVHIKYRMEITELLLRELYSFLLFLRKFRINNITNIVKKPAIRSTKNSIHRLFIDNRETRADTVAKNNKKLVAKNRIMVALSSLSEPSANRLIASSVVPLFFLGGISTVSIFYLKP